MNNEQKLEKALELAVRDADKCGADAFCKRECPYSDDDRLNHCWECGVAYYKRKAGIDNKKQMPERERSASK